MLGNFVEHRNQLTHRLRDIAGWDQDTAEGQKVATGCLSQLQAENMKVLQIFAGFLLAWENQRKLGIVKDLPPEIFELLPEIPIFAAMINDFVFREGRYHFQITAAGLSLEPEHCDPFSSEKSTIREITASLNSSLVDPHAVSATNSKFTARITSARPGNQS